ncbi:restriction endonuclease subunit S [Escherichia coli]|uniref:restriction endonuclease subunit S n=1 Tax=Escherichia coli TaxID=562 RepID=UPI002101A36D|nr:restriction endonuclease subunit S [Escherichia coli]ELP4022651.1 restriction endonuclease subunit S [Escherichia coli]MCQ1676364.1 restriction endonuclease subunit S [Escherichia coli]
MGSKWIEVSLGEISEKIGDGIHGTPTYNNSGNYYFINGSNLIDNSIKITETTKCVDHDEYLKHRKKLSNNTVLVSINGTIGNTALYNNENIILGKSACYINLKDNISKHFILYVLSGYLFQEYIQRCSTGSTIKNVSLKMMRDFRFLMPESKEEQEKVVRIIQKIDELKRLNNAQNQTLEQMSQTLFKSWFVDFDPVIDNALDAGNPIPEALQTRVELRKKVRNSVDFKPLSAEIRSLFPSEFEETELGWVPKGWTLKSVAKSININPSIKLPKNKIAKYVDMKSLPTQGYSISDIIEKPYSGGAKFQNNDTLFARITPCLENGKTGFVDFLDEKETAFGSTEFIVMRGTPQVHYLYVACLARESNFRLHAIQNMVGSSGRQRVQNSCFDSFYIAIPTPAVMSLFSGKVSSYFDKMYFCNLENKSLTTLRDTLLPKLISGELSLEDLPDLSTNTEAA